MRFTNGKTRVTDYGEFKDSVYQWFRPRPTTESNYTGRPYCSIFTVSELVCQRDVCEAIRSA